MRRLTPQFSGLTEYWYLLDDGKSNKVFSNKGNCKRLAYCKIHHKRHFCEKYYKVCKSKKYPNIRCMNNSVHRFLALFFIPNLENKSQVNHIDGNKHNYSLWNLEWTTPLENTRHAHKNGLVDYSKISKSLIGSKRRKDHTIYHFYNSITQESVFGKQEYLKLHSKTLFGMSDNYVKKVLKGDKKKGWEKVG